MKRHPSFTARPSGPRSRCSPASRIFPIQSRPAWSARRPRTKSCTPASASARPSCGPRTGNARENRAFRHIALDHGRQRSGRRSGVRRCQTGDRCLCPSARLSFRHDSECSPTASACRGWSTCNRRRRLCRIESVDARLDRSGHTGTGSSASANDGAADDGDQDNQYRRKRAKSATASGADITLYRVRSVPKNLNQMVSTAGRFPLPLALEKSGLVSARGPR